jgi:hypothetical protein
MMIGPGVPIQFTQVNDPSHADHLAGFTYYYSVNGGNYASSVDP